MVGEEEGRFSAEVWNSICRSRAGGRCGEESVRRAEGWQGNGYVGAVDGGEEVLDVRPDKGGEEGGEAVDGDGKEEGEGEEQR